jgi:hypothetical protein
LFVFIGNLSNWFSVLLDESACICAAAQHSDRILGEEFGKIKLKP